MEVLNSICFAGPNRRSDLTVVEQHVRFGSQDLHCFEAGGPAFPKRLEQALDDLLSRKHAALANWIDCPGRPEERLGRLYASTAIALQRSASHIVSVTGVESGAEPGHCRPFFEYEEVRTGRAAAELTETIFRGLLETGGGWPAPGALESLRNRVQDFIQESKPRAMPHDARAIYEAARRRGIPCFRMDRPPYHPVEGPFRVRPNALFRLGHGHRQHTVDGTFCVDLSEPSHALIRDRQKLCRKLETLDVPLPSGRQATRFCLTADRAARIAAQRGFPVVVRPAIRADRRGVTLNLHDSESVRQAAEVALRWADQVLVEPFVPGRAYRLVLAGGRTLAVLEDTGMPEHGGHRYRPVDETHDSLPELGGRIAAAFNTGLAVVTIVTPDVRRGIRDAGGAVVDVDLAPRLDRLFMPDDPALRAAATAFMDWMFPRPDEARIPIVAITGTNGKTTTCRMVSSIMKAAGYRTGMACSDGTYINGHRVSQLEDGYLPGHLTVLDNSQVEMAVLESTRGGAGSVGLGFDWCNAAACLNVTPDHFNDAVGTRTLEDLAALKRWIVERARDAVVLNADDPRCLAMAEQLENRRIGLTSLNDTGENLLALAGPRGIACVEERINDSSWVVFYEAASRKTVMRVSDIPVTFGGLARHNVSNALHAAALCHLLGVGIDAIERGLAGLEASFESVPGRLNFYRGLPFDVIMDYAHNPDGIRHICLFVNRLSVKGRKILAMSCDTHNSDDFYRDTAGVAAGHFDHYVCKNFGYLVNRQPVEGPRLLREGLLAGGVSPDDITCIPDEFEAIDAALGMAREGDLVVILAGKRKQQIWDWINSFGERHGVQTRASNSVGQRSPSS